MTLSQVASSMVPTGPPSPTPAAVTRISIRPKSCTARSASACCAAPSVTSSNSRRLCGESSSTLCHSADSFRSVPMTIAPSRAKRCAQASPIPDAAPVTMATLFSNAGMLCPPANGVICVIAGVSHTALCKGVILRITVLRPAPHINDFPGPEQCHLALVILVETALDRRVLPDQLRMQFTETAVIVRVHFRPALQARGAALNHRFQAFHDVTDLAFAVEYQAAAKGEVGAGAVHTI